LYLLGDDPQTPDVGFADKAAVYLGLPARPGWFIAEVLRAYETLFFRYENSFQDIF
jgi:hypothetical protein